MHYHVKCSVSYMEKCQATETAIYSQSSSYRQSTLFQGYKDCRLHKFTFTRCAVTNLLQSVITFLLFASPKNHYCMSFQSYFRIFTRKICAVLTCRVGSGLSHHCKMAAHSTVFLMMFLVAISSRPGFAYPGQYAIIYCSIFRILNIRQLNETIGIRPSLLELVANSWARFRKHTAVMYVHLLESLSNMTSTHHFVSIKLHYYIKQDIAYGIEHKEILSNENWHV